jgi:hypothetical protein
MTTAKRENQARLVLRAWTGRLLAGGTLAGIVVAAASCAGTPYSFGASQHLTLAERTEKLKKWRAREMAPAGIKSVVLLDGLASGELESKTELRPECKKTSADGAQCTVKADLGKDEEGDAADVFCDVTTDAQAFGVLLHTLLGKSRLDEVPELEVAPMGEGITAWFVSDTRRKDDSKTVFGTVKLAALYAHGYVGLCFDMSSGGRQTFKRTAGHFFESLRFKDNPKSNALFAYGQREQVGDRTTGFRYAVLSKRAEPDEGYLEMSTHFVLDTDGKTWKVTDSVRVVVRDDKGGIDKMTDLFWFSGKGPFTLSAKPSEDRKFRLKFDDGRKSSGLESTPKAPLNTELWALPELRRVASGAAPSYRYAFLDLLDTDPAFHYVTLTRTAPGVLLEEQEPLTAPGKKSAAGENSKDELHVDSHGFVIKEVTTHSVSELIHTWGELPALLGGKKGTPTQLSGR